MAVKTEPWDVGDDVTFFTVFENAAGAPTTPADYDLTVQAPDGTETHFAKAALTNPSAGRVEKVVRMTASGRWYGRFRSLVTPQVTKEFTTPVRDTQFETP